MSLIVNAKTETEIRYFRKQIKIKIKMLAKSSQGSEDGRKKFYFKKGLAVLHLRLIAF